LKIPESQINQTGLTGRKINRVSGTEGLISSLLPPVDSHHTLFSRDETH